MAEEAAARAELVRARKASEAERDEATTRRRRASRGGLVSLQRLAAVFSRSQHQPLPPDVEPGSIEAMRHCGYLRGQHENEGADILEEVQFKTVTSKRRRTSRTLSDDRESLGGACSRRTSRVASVE